MYYFVVELQPNLDNRYVLMYCRTFFTQSLANKHTVVLRLRPLVTFIMNITFFTEQTKIKRTG